MIRNDDKLLGIWKEAVMDFLGTITAFAWRGLEKPLKTQVSTAGILIDIQTGYF
jgi:hypothetical protein